MYCIVAKWLVADFKSLSPHCCRYDPLQGPLVHVRKLPHLTYGMSVILARSPSMHKKCLIGLLWSSSTSKMQALVACLKHQMLAPKKLNSQLITVVDVRKNIQSENRIAPKFQHGFVCKLMLLTPPQQGINSQKEGKCIACM